MKLVGYKLLLAALGTGMVIAGCRSRGELFTGTSMPHPVRTFTAEVLNRASRDEPDTARLEQAPPAAAEPAQEDDPLSVSTEASTQRTPIEILKAAGAIIEYDRNQSPVGLDLTAARISDGVTRAAAELGSLQWLDVRGARVTDADVAILATLPRLQLLALGETLVTDAGLRHLQQQKELRFLSLDQTGVTDAGLDALAGLPHLEGVSVSGTVISRAAAARLEERMPGCRVILDDNAPEGPAETDPAAKTSVPGDATSGHHPFDDLEEPPAFPDSAAESGPISLDEGLRSGAGTGGELQQVLQKKLLDPEVLAALSRHLMAQKDYEKAAKTLEALCAIQPGDRQARFQLAIAQGRSGRFDIAERTFLTVVDEATASFNLGVIAFEMDQKAQSERFFARAAALAPDSSQARDWLARVRTSVQISPATDVSQPLDHQDLLELLLSEIGAGSDAGTVRTPPSGIEIVPAIQGRDQQAAAAKQLPLIEQTGALQLSPLR
jgi:tetratricopeptide (TPR) repeat protein